MHLLISLLKKNNKFTFSEAELSTVFGFGAYSNGKSLIFDSDDESISCLIYNYLLHLSEDWKDKLSIRFFEEISSKQDSNIIYPLVEREIQNLVQKLAR